MSVRRHAHGKLFIVSSPSGGGKTTLCKHLIADVPSVVPSISVTTRPPRPGEKNGVDYYFVSLARFRQMVKRGSFLEYEQNFGHWYGTPKRAVMRLLSRGISVLLSIDVKGAMQVRRVFPDESVLIFIMPPSLAALKKRLTGRRADGAAAIATRLSWARRELAYRRRYDYIIVNDRLSRAAAALTQVVRDELLCKEACAWLK